MEETSITVSSPIDFWTQYRATLAVLNRTRSTIFAWGFFVGLPLLSLILMPGLGQDVCAPAAFGLPSWAVPLGGLLFMLVFVPLLQLLNVWSYRRHNRSVGGVHTFTVTSEGYSVSGSLFDTRLKWDAILKAIETKDFVLLYIAPRWAHFIPKSAITADSDLRAIRSILQDKLGAKARLRSYA